MTSTTLQAPLQNAPFDALAATYDEAFTDSLIGRAQRDAVWQEFDRVFHPGQRILEINCGTGVDAVYLASRGVEVVACDVAPRMIEVARQRALQAKLRAPITLRVLAIEEIGNLRDEGPFDGVLSNFAGLNCVQDLSQVARDLSELLKPGAVALLCLFGPFCAWETAWYLARGNLRTAFRRVRPGKGSAQLAEGVTVQVRYPSVYALTRIFAPHFCRKAWKGVGVAVPPSYAEPLARRFPRALTVLAKIDRFLGRAPILRGMADHILLTLERVRT